MRRASISRTPRLRQTTVIIGFVVVAGASCFAAGSPTPGDALLALWRGSFGSWFAFTSGTLVRATPLILTGLAVALAFRAGVFNIGAEGQLLVGATLAAALGVAFGNHLGGTAVWVEMVAGAVAGGCWAWIAAMLRVRFGVLEVISTLMLNFIALYLVGFLVRGPLQEHTRVYPQSESLPANARLWILHGSRLHAGFFIAVIASGVGWWTMHFTEQGFRWRVVGANPAAARMAGGIDVDRETALAFISSGALAGLAGAIQVAGVTFALYEDLSPGYGYTAIAVALLARLEPGAVWLTGILFGGLESGANAMQRDASVPSVVASMVEASLILAVVAVGQVRLSTTWRTRASIAVGSPDT